MGGERLRRAVMLILDVANILHVLTRGRAPGDGDVLELVGWLANSRYGKQEVTLVCDGNPMRASGLRDRVVAAMAAAGNTRQLLFSGPDRQADDVVEGLLEHATSPATVVVVSSDRRLRDAAKRMGAKSLRSEEFAEQLHDDARRRTFAGDAGREVGNISAAAWAAYFGIDLATGLPKQTAHARAKVKRRGSEGPSVASPDASRRKPLADDGQVDCQAAALGALQERLHGPMLDDIREIDDIESSQLDMELWLKQFPAETSGKSGDARGGRAKDRRRGGR